MSEMVERMARAAHAKMNAHMTRPFRNCSWEELKPASRAAWCEGISAAIEAMREPTEAMAHAIKHTRLGEDGVGWWRAGIDAALGEK
jgi:hypothetical protein